MGDPGDGDFGAGFDELVGFERGSRAVCDGARWNILQDRGRDSPKIPDAGTGADFSVRTGEFDGVDRDIRRGGESIYFRRLGFLWGCGGGPFPVAANLTGYAAAVP